MQISLTLALLDLVQDISASYKEQHNLEMIALSLDKGLLSEQHQDGSTGYDYGDALCKLQMFTLGYWYRLLHPLVESSQMASIVSASSGSNVVARETKEAYGAWSWSDIDCLGFLRDVVGTKLHRQTQSGKAYSLYRFGILKLVAFLFGGSEITQLKNAKFGTVGFHGKLTTLYPSALGSGLDLIGKICLLDIDSTCIPSTISGLIMPGTPSRAVLRAPMSTEKISVDRFDLQTLRTIQPDLFTVHIEPDWDHDVQNCVVTYRHGGRIVHRVNPRQIDVVLMDILASQCDNEEANSDED